MAKRRSQLNINIDPELLIKLKNEAIRSGKTLTEYVTNQLSNVSNVPQQSPLEQRLLLIEEHLGISETKPALEQTMGSIFTDEGAKRYGAVAKKLFESSYKKMGITQEKALRELAVHLNCYEHSDPELVFQLLLGNHDLTGLEMTYAYRKGSCAMRSALADWSKETLEELDEAFLSAVVTKSLT